MRSTKSMCMIGMRLPALLVVAAALGGCGRRAEAKQNPVPVTATTPAPAPPRTYVVEARDGWMKIASDNRVPMADLLAANDATVQTALHPGQTLVLPDGTRPTSRSTATPARVSTATPPAPVRPAPQPAVVVSGCTCRDGTAGCCGRGCCSHHGGITR